MKLGKYSFGIGDRFSHEGKAQLAALIEGAGKYPFEFVPVWNKSNREHQIIGTEPADTRREADDAVMAMGYGKPYFVDADHINMNNVDRFIDASDFFTIDVADYIGKPADADSVRLSQYQTSLWNRLWNTHASLQSASAKNFRYRFTATKAQLSNLSAATLQTAVLVNTKLCQSASAAKNGIQISVRANGTTA